MVTLMVLAAPVHLTSRQVWELMEAVTFLFQKYGVTEFGGFPAFSVLLGTLAQLAFLIFALLDLIAPP